MTLKVRVQVPRSNGNYEAQITQPNGIVNVLEPGDELELYLHDTNTFQVAEVPSGTKAAQAAKT